MSASFSSSSEIPGIVGGLARRGTAEDVSRFGAGRRARGGGGGSGVVDTRWDMLNDFRMRPKCFMRAWVFLMLLAVSTRENTLLRTALSASNKIFLDFSRSFFNWEESAISEARSRRFSTYRVEIWAFNSSIRTLSVELSLKVAHNKQTCQRYEFVSSLRYVLVC